MKNLGVDTEMVNLMYPGIDTHWTLYVDPVTSIVLTGLILYTTLGLLKGKFHNLRVSQSLFSTSSNFDQNLVLDPFDYANSKNRIGLTLGRRILELQIFSVGVPHLRQLPLKVP